jgi:hypothetical protein
LKQGVVNLLQGLQDTAFDLGNFALIGNDPVRMLDLMLNGPMFESPQWARDRYVRESDFEYAASKFLTSQGFLLLLGAAEAQLLKAMPKSTAVIGKLGDLENIGKNEHTLLKHMTDDLGCVKANWNKNSSVLRQEIRKGNPIRDASVDTAGQLRDNTGFLRAERNLLESMGWKYDPITQTWHP